jgi:hypothetical protein
MLSLNVSDRCGLSRNAVQTRPTVDFDRPQRLAFKVRDRCVASFGVDSAPRYRGFITVK